MCVTLSPLSCVSQPLCVFRRAHNARYYKIGVSTTKIGSPLQKRGRLARAQANGCWLDLSRSIALVKRRLFIAPYDDETDRAAAAAAAAMRNLKKQNTKEE